MRGFTSPFSLLFFFLPPAHPWQGRQQTYWNELSINFSDVLNLDLASPFHSGNPFAHHPKSGYVDFYIISTKGYHTHTPCWHLKGEKSKKKDGKYFGFKMGNLGIDFFVAYRLFGDPTAQAVFSFFFWKDFLFRFRFTIPFAGKHRLPSQSTKAGERLGITTNRILSCWFLNAAAFCFFSF